MKLKKIENLGDYRFYFQFEDGVQERVNIKELISDKVTVFV